MFDGLSKYKVVKEFNGYRKGVCVAFNGADAEKYAQYIVACKKAVAVAPVEPLVVEEKQQEVVSAKPKRKVVRKGKK